MFLRNTSHSKTDEELLHLYQSTHKLEWLSALFLRYASLVYGVCLKYLRDREVAKDAVMQIHEKLITSLREHRVDNFRSWLYVLSRNHCLMQLRSQKGKETLELSPLLMENGIPEHPEEEALEVNLERLEKCIEKLLESQQRCVRLFYLQEKCYREIADETGFDLNRVKSYIQNGKRNLKICMEEHGQ